MLQGQKSNGILQEVGQESMQEKWPNIVGGSRQGIKLAVAYSAKRWGVRSGPRPCRPSDVNMGVVIDPRCCGMLV